MTLSLYVDATETHTPPSSLAVRPLVAFKGHADADSVLRIGGGINDAVLQAFLPLINIELRKAQIRCVVVHLSVVFKWSFKV